MNFAADFAPYLMPVLGFLILVGRLARPKREIMIWQSRSKKSTNLVSLEMESRIFQAEGSTSELAIVIPARDEAKRLPTCLRSLIDIPSNWKVVVVDDHSTDETSLLASAFKNVQVLPADQTGKSNACQQGADATSHFKYILFTDADTVHDVKKIIGALRTAKINQVGLLASLPFYLTPLWWERFLASFYTWITLITNAFGAPQHKRLYANGQFLLFDREAYQRLGGHKAVAHHLAEDILFAQHTIAAEETFGVLQDPAYAVHMYSGISEFYKGWRRLFQIGFQFSSPRTSVEILCVMSALSACFVHFTPLAVALTLISTFLFWRASRSLGNFPWWTVFFGWLTLPLFILIAGDAGVRRIFKRAIVWRTRSYLVSS